MIHNLIYQTKVTGVTKCLKAHVKIRSFSMGYSKYEHKKYIISYKTSLGYDMQYTVNARIILLYYIHVFSLFS